MNEELTLAPRSRHGAHPCCRICRLLLGTRTPATHRLNKNDHPPIPVCRPHGERMTAGRPPAGLCTTCWLVNLRDAPAEGERTGNEDLCRECRGGVVGRVVTSR